MPTKAELEQKIEDLEHDIRRLNRSINQTRLDLEDLPTNAFKKNFQHHNSANKQDKPLIVLMVNLIKW